MSGADCLKLGCWLGERERAGGRPVAERLMGLFAEAGVQASVLLRGVEGFGLRQHVRTDRLLTLSEDLPVLAQAIDARARIEQVLPEVMRLKRRGLLTLERARLLRGEEIGGIGADANADGLLPAAERDGEAVKLTVHIGRHRRVGGRPAFVAACETLARNGAAGATVLLGVDGTRNGVRHRARLIGRNEEVPMLVVSVGQRGPIRAALPELAQTLDRPLFTIERVRVCRRDGQALADPHELAGTDGDGLAIWQKLTVVSSEATLCDGVPLHLALLRAMRTAGVAGGTALRGIWGFHGEHAPHGERLLSLRRHVPVMTSIVDAPERIERVFPIVAQITAHRGLVTSEMVPAMLSRAGETNMGELRMSAPR